MNYIKQLDGLRAVAIILVVIVHWFPETHPLNIYTRLFNGVDIFFVLSGFLITRILLVNRVDSELKGSDSKGIVRNFFIRRFLRIFPIYYLLVIGLFVIAGYTGTHIKTNFVYLVTYTANFYFFTHGWDGMLSHLWSLSVEEQFYILWPWLMLYLNKKALLWAILTSIMIGIGTQLLLKPVPLGNILTFCCFDGFGLGALLAWMAVYRIGVLKRALPFFGFAAIAGCSLQILRVTHPVAFAILPSRTLTSLCTVWVILIFLLEKDGKASLLSRLFKNRALVFIGKISYGAYLFHLPLPYLTDPLLNRINSHLPAGLYRYNLFLISIENFCLLLLVSYFSWRVIEMPFTRLKRHFEYQKPATILQPVSRT